MLRIEIAKLADEVTPEQGPVDSEPAEPPCRSVSGPSPFAYRARGVGTIDEAENPALAEYNRMLASLAATTATTNVASRNRKDDRCRSRRPCATTGWPPG